MAFDIKALLTQEGKLTPEQADAFVQQYGSNLGPVFEATHAQRETLAQQQARLASEQAALQQANESLNREMAEWATLSTKEKEAALQQQAALEAARVRNAQIETRLAAAATQYGFDANAILEGTTPIPEKKEPVVPPFDTSKFVARDQVAPVFDYQLELMGQLPHLVAEHQRLFGEPLDTRAIVKEIKARAAKNDPNIDPTGIWEEKFGVPAKRAEVQKQQYDAAIAAAEARGREAAMTERAMPGPANPGKHSPVFRNADGQFAPRTSRLQRPMPESTLRNAVSAFTTGKYRDKDTGAR